MARLLYLLILTCATAAAATAQFPGQMPPPHDMCAKAIEVVPGDILPGHTNADATPSLDYERPAVWENTCIQTIENDVWYKFKAEEGALLYEVQIVAGFCTTPAGLQALLIKADGCSASTFIYRGCSNKINRDTIKLFLPDPEPGQNYFIWVDGYDGTVCEFEISLRAKKAMLYPDYRLLRFDYTLDDPKTLDLLDFTQNFANNAPSFSWSAEASEVPDLYIIELLPDLTELNDDSKYARVVGFVDPHHYVGSGGSHYSFTDYVTPFEQGKSYRYRVVAVDANGGRRSTQDFQVRAKLVESFDVREVKAAAEPGKFTAHYVNRKKGAKFNVSVQDAAGKQVKFMVLDNEPQRDGDITIDMSALPHGEYTFIMANGKDSFRRIFYW